MLRVIKIFILLAYSLPVMADSYLDGLRAYQHQQFSKALTLLKPLAEQGHADAQFHLGMMYDNGLGVSKDPDLAELWYNRACPVDSKPDPDDPDEEEDR